MNPRVSVDLLQLEQRQHDRDNDASDDEDGDSIHGSDNSYSTVPRYVNSEGDEISWTQEASGYEVAEQGWDEATSSDLEYYEEE